MKWLLAILLFFTDKLPAQEYKFEPRADDTFSQNLLALIHAAPTYFKDYKGAFLRHNELGEGEYGIRLSLPGSPAGIIRHRMSGSPLADAYFEFRGFDSRKAAIEGIRQLSGRIKQALGAQVKTSNNDSLHASQGFAGFYLRDANGFFAMNLELMYGSSSAPVYLHGPLRSDTTKPQQHFVLLKISGGMPTYFHHVRPVDPAIEGLDGSLNYFLFKAGRDFQVFKDSLLLKRGEDTIMHNHREYVFNARGSHYFVKTRFAVPADKAEADSLWEKLHQTIQASVGWEYVFFHSNFESRKGIHYVVWGLPANEPIVRLEYDASEGEYFVLRVESGFSHQTSRALKEW